MKFRFTDQEIALLKAAEIHFDENYDYSDDEAVFLLEQVRDVEVSFSQFSGGEQRKKYYKYGNLANKIHATIPE